MTLVSICIYMSIWPLPDLKQQQFICPWQQEYFVMSFWRTFLRRQYWVTPQVIGMNCPQNQAIQCFLLLLFLLFVVSCVVVMWWNRVFGMYSKHKREDGDIIFKISFTPKKRALTNAANSTRALHDHVTHGSLKHVCAWYITIKISYFQTIASIEQISHTIEGLDSSLRVFDRFSWDTAHGGCWCLVGGSWKVAILADMEIVLN